MLKNKPAGHEIRNSIKKTRLKQKLKMQYCSMDGMSMDITSRYYPSHAHYVKLAETGNPSCLPIQQLHEHFPTKFWKG
jgi:hypothetical protein